MARDKPQAWRSVAYVDPFRFPEETRKEFSTKGLPDDLIRAVEQFLEDFIPYAKLYQDSPTLGVVKETIRRGEVAHKKGETAFNDWLKSCDSKTMTRLWFAARDSANLCLEIRYDTFPEAARSALSTLDNKPGKRGPRVNDPKYEIAERIYALFVVFGQKVTNYEPHEIAAIGSKGGSLFASVLHAAFRACGSATSDASPFIEHAIEHHLKHTLKQIPPLGN